jgi:hypothetical protein
MAIEDVIAKIRAEQAAQEQADIAAKKAAEEQKTREETRLAGLAKNKNMRKDADRLRKEKAQLDGIIKELATGKYTEGSRGYFTLLGQATLLEKSISALEKKLGFTEQEDAVTGNAPTGTTSTKPVVTSVSKPTATSSSSKTKKQPVKGTVPEVPTGGDTATAGAGFNPARVRMGEEASMGAAKPTDIGGAITGKRTLESILGDVQNYFDLPDYIFRLDKDLGNLLERAVNEKWTTARWDKEIEMTNWWRKNSDDVRKRLISFGNYDDLRSQGQDVSKSDYGLWLSKKKGQLKADARAIAGVAITDQQAEEIAKKIYLGFLDDDENAIRAFLVPFIGKTTSIVGGKTITGFSGQALKDYQTLQSIAKANGFSLSQILPGISATTTGGDLEEAVLEKIALGELDVNRISQDARMMAAIGQPEMVRNLLNQGYDLDQIYAPYKNTMATVLELNPEQIALNDPTLRSAISDKGETNLYDFQRMLRKDSRWQYTQNARQEVSDITLNVLRDFGFQG